MRELRGWIIFGWFMLPLVMIGGYLLLQVVLRDEQSVFEQTMYRATHAHAGVLALMSLLFFHFLDQTLLPRAVKHAACATLLLGYFAQVGGFFIQYRIGRPASVGITITLIGALLLTLAIAVLVYGLLKVRPGTKE